MSWLKHKKRTQSAFRLVPSISLSMLPPGWMLHGQMKVRFTTQKKRITGSKQEEALTDTLWESRRRTKSLVSSTYFRGTSWLVQLLGDILNRRNVVSLNEDKNVSAGPLCEGVASFHHCWQLVTCEQNVSHFVTAAILAWGRRGNSC